MSSDQEPLLLYKYLSGKTAMKLLRNLTVFANLPTKFNDPFELAPKVDKKQFDERRIRAAHRKQMEADEARLRKEGIVVSPALRRRFLRERLPINVKEAVAKRDANIDAACREFPRMFQKLFRIFCVSLRRDSILMWSHYAEGHCGVVVGLAAEPHLFARPKSVLNCLKVDYRNAKALIDMGRFMDSVEQVVMRKAPDWRYEKEVRFIMKRNRSGLYRIRAAAVREVILGVNASERLHQRVRSVLKRPHFEHVTLHMASRDPAGFRIRFETVSPFPSPVETKRDKRFLTDY